MKAKLHVKTKGNVKILMKLLSQSQGNNSKNINLILKNSYKGTIIYVRSVFFLSEVFS